MSKKSKSKVRFIVFASGNEMIITTPKLEKQTLKDYFGVQLNRLCYPEEDVAKDYKDTDEGRSFEGITYFERNEIMEDTVFVSTKLELV